MFDTLSPELKQAAPGIGGSLLALFFLRRPPFVLAAIFFGGCFLALYAPAAATHYFGIDVRFTGLVGFVIGLFGMALVAKAYDIIEAISAVDLWKTILDWVRKKLGVS